MLFFQLFGIGNAPPNSTRYPDFCCGALSVVCAIAAIDCAYDMLAVEIAKTVESAYSSWWGFARLCGWDVPDVKSPPPARIFRALGAMVDLSGFPLGPLRFCPAVERVEGLCKALGDIMTAKVLSPALAGKMYGKLIFLLLSALVVWALLSCGCSHAASTSMAEALLIRRLLRPSNSVYQTRGI